MLYSLALIGAHINLMGAQRYLLRFAESAIAVHSEQPDPASQLANSVANDKSANAIGLCTPVAAVLASIGILARKRQPIGLIAAAVAIESSLMAIAVPQLIRLPTALLWASWLVIAAYIYRRFPSLFAEPQ
jgi:hypothetical protein